MALGRQETRDCSIIVAGGLVFLLRQLLEQKLKKQNKTESKAATPVTSLIAFWYARYFREKSRIIQLKYPPVAASGRKFKTSPPSKYFVFSQQDRSHFLCDPPGKPCSGQDIFVTVDCRAKRLVGQLPPHSPDYMPTMSRLV